MNEESFLHAILDNPDDDTPRLIYADWLEEHHQSARAELIRVQCSLARLPEGNPRKRELEAREEDLLGQHEAKWTEPVQEMIGDWVFHRGMMGVAVSVSQLLAHASSLSRCPLIHSIDVVDHAVGRSGIEALAACPQLERVTILKLAGWYCYDDPGDLVDDEQAALLAGSPHAWRLTALNLRCNQIGDAGVQAFARSDHLRSLKELDLRANLFGDAGLLDLAGWPRPGQLEWLDIGYEDGRPRTGAGWRGLAAAPDLERLKGLFLVGNTIADASKAALKKRLGDRVQL